MFHSIQKQVSSAFRAHIGARYGIDVAVAIEEPRQSEFGEMAVPAAFQLAKQLRQAPRKIAQELAGEIGPIAGVGAMEVAGKQFDAQPQCIRQGFHGELLDPNLIVKTPTGGQLKIDDKNIICRVQQLDICAGGNKTAVTVYYSDTVSPYILKRESVTTGADEKVLGETTMNVVSLDVPYKVLAETKRVARLKTVQRHTKGVVTTEAMTSPDVPGGIVHTTSKETDANGRLTRQSVLELVSFGLKGEEERTGLFGRKRPARMRKSATNSASW